MHGTTILFQIAAVLLLTSDLAAGVRDLQQSGRGNSGGNSGRRPTITRITPTSTPASAAPVTAAPVTVATATTTASTASTTAAGTTAPSATAVAATAAPAASLAASDGKFDPLRTPSGNECPAPNGEARGYPNTPFNLRPFVFTKPFKELTPKAKSFRQCNDTLGTCLDVYDFDIVEFKTDYGFTGTVCAGNSVPTLGYDGVAPGPIVIAEQGVQDLVRFTHKVPAGSLMFPPGGPGNAGAGETNICKNRPVRSPGAPIGAGRGFSVHHHGMASLSSMDGWADQYFCAGETRDYVLPNSRPATMFYHDHAVGITSENTYNGASGMRITRPCSEQNPYELNGIQEHFLQLGDFVLSRPRSNEPGVCRRRYDRKGVHESQLWGDINTVNGVPWPVLDIAAKWHRFRILNAAASRPFLLSFKDSEGKDVSDACHIVGADGGFAEKAVTMEPGLMTDVAYRWDIVCDFEGFENQVLYLWNEHDADRTTSETPYFCFSHLLMRINVGGREDAPEPNLSGGELDQKAQLPEKLLDALEARALAGDADRDLEFGKKNGNLWLMNGRGWDDPRKPRHIEFSNVGQNNVELWNLKSGGGWIHPVHVHLVDFFCLAMKGGDGGGWRKCPEYLQRMPKDVIHIGANVRELIVGARFGPHIGEYMTHCHNTVHEDHEMMRAFLVVDAQKGLTVSRTPSLNYTLLANTPIDKAQASGLDRNTTYPTAAAPPLTPAFAQTILERRYYDVFSPAAGSTFNDLANNIWLATCAAQEAASEGVLG